MRTLLALVLLAVAAEAGPISIGPWYEFGFDPDHFPSVAGCLPDDPAGVPCRAGIGSINLDAPPWTFTNSSPVLLTVTDAFLAGDSFSVFDFGALVGSTPIVGLGPFCGLDPNVCLADPAFSHASFNLPAGPHSLTITVQAAQLLGEGFLMVSSVPEPSYSGVFAVLVVLCFVRISRNRMQHHL
jgi:hypothetical protein